MDSGVLGGLWFDKMCCQMRNHLWYLVVAKCCAFQTRKVLGRALLSTSIGWVSGCGLGIDWFSPFTCYRLYVKSLNGYKGADWFSPSPVTGGMWIHWIVSRISRTPEAPSYVHPKNRGFEVSKMEGLTFYIEEVGCSKLERLLGPSKLRGFDR